MAPLDVFSVSLCANGMVPETPLGQKDPCNLTWIKDEQAGGAPGEAVCTNQLCVQSGHESALKRTNEPSVQKNEQTNMNCRITGDDLSQQLFFLDLFNFFSLI